MKATMPFDVGQNEVDRLRRAVESLYGAFRIYPRPLHDAACPHCSPDPAQQPLHTRPLRELTSDELSTFAWSALLTWGSAPDLKHFLPRLFELMAFGEPPSDVEALLHKLSLAQWRTWPVHEQIAIEEFLDALWAAVLEDRTTDPNPRVDEWLCGLARATSVADFEFYLQYWEAHLEGRPAEHLGRFAADTFEAMMVGRALRNPFWVDRPEHEKALRKWLASPGLRSALERAFFLHADAPFAQALSDTLSLLDVYAMMLKRKET